MQGDKVTARVSGNLNIETLQEKETYEEQNTSAGFGISWNVNMTKTKTTGPNKESIETTTRSFAKPNIGGSFNKGTINSHYRSARDQAGIFVGKGGFDLLVGKNTDLKGALIASKAPADKNKLSTGTLSFSDLENEADYSAKSIGAAYHKYGNYENMTKAEKDKVYNTKGLAPNISMPVKGNASSRTTSAIAEGTIDIRENPTQDISALSRDTENVLNELGRIFDKKKIEEQQELAAIFGEEAFRLAHNLKDDGSGRKIAVHAIIGGIMSQITGAGFASGAVGAGLNEALINAVKGKDPGTAQIVSAIIGAAAAKVAGGSAAAGASAAAAGTKWNKYERLPEILEQLNELNESEKYKELKDGEYSIRYATVDGEKVAVAIDKDGNVFDLEVIHDAGIDQMMLHGNPLMKKGEVYTIDKMDHYGELNAQKTGEQAVFRRGDADGHITSLLTFADRERKEAINRVLFAPLLQFVEFGSKVAQFNKGFIKSIAKNLTPDFQFDPNPAKKHYTFETREEILGEIAGDVVSSAAGAAMFFGGASAAAGGSVATALTGIGITITPAVAATGATVAIYGGATAFHAGQNLVEDISRFKASTSGNGSATPPKLDTAESAVEKLDVPGISRFIRTEKNVPSHLPSGKPMPQESMGNTAEKNILGFDKTTLMKASDLREYAKKQGWHREQTGNGPEFWMDENNVKRITIKRGSPRTPGSETPHVEIRNAQGERIDSNGNPVTRKSPQNHTPIEYDLSD